jgi:putative transposase
VAHAVRWFSTYCLTTSEVDPPTVATKQLLVRSAQSRDARDGNPTSVRVHQDCLGYGYASLVVRHEVRPAPEIFGSIGIDWRASTTATTTDPAFDLPHLGHGPRCAAELTEAQAMVSRRHHKGVAHSNGYRRAKREAAKPHQKAQRHNSHVGRIWSKNVVDNYQVITVEGSKPRFVAKSMMAPKSAEAAIGAAKRELIEGGTRARRTVVLVAPACTAMTCSRCCQRQARLDLSERTFRCQACGFQTDRDWNAARTILATAERIRAGADDVRHLLPPLGDVVDAVRLRNPPASAVGNR